MKRLVGQYRLLLTLMVMLSLLASACSVGAWEFRAFPVANTTGKVGRAYYSVLDHSGTLVAGLSTAGTFASAAATPAIRGIPTGSSYTVQGFIDYQGTGFQHANDPTFTYGPISGDAIVPVSFTLPAPVAAVAPGKPRVSPLDGAAFVNFDRPQMNNGVAVADSYNIYWSTNSNPGPGNTVNGGQLLNITTKEPKIVIYNLTNGSTLYFAVTAVANGTSATSPVSDPVTINAPAVSGTTVSVTVDTTGIAKNGTLTPLIVALSDENNAVYFNYVKAPVDLQTVQVTGVPAGTYKIFAILDLDGKGNLDARANPSLFSDWDRGQRPLPIMVDGVSANVTGPRIKLAARSSAVQVGTMHTRIFGQSPSDGYRLTIKTGQQNKPLVNVSLDSGPQIAGPVDFSWDFYNPGQFKLEVPVGSRPAVGDSYALTLRYADGTSEPVTSAVTGVLDVFPGGFFPVGTTGPGSVQPTFGWSNPGPTGFLYSTVDFNNLNGDFLSMSTLATPYQDVPLSVGQSYSWSRTVRDLDGNQTRTDLSFTPNATGPVITDFNPKGGPAGTAVTITGTGFSATPLNNSVSFNGFAATVTAASATSLTVTAPASSGLITVNVGGVTAGSSVPFAATTTMTVTLTEGADGTTPMTAASIALLETPNQVTTSNVGGVYTLPVPARPTYTLTMNQVGHLPVHSALMSVTAPLSGKFSLYRVTDLDARLVPGSNKGLLMSRVQDGSGNGNTNVAGAVVTVTSLLHPDTPYTIIYNGATGALDPAATSTNADGLFFVANVDDGDYVTITASKAGMAFQTKVFNTHAGVISMGGVRGAAASPVTATPPPGSYGVPQTVTLTATANDNIFYTTNGSDPVAFGTLYTVPILVTPPTTLKMVTRNKFTGTIGNVQNALYNVGGQAASASGTYTFVPVSGALTLTWTSSTFPCNGPSVGVESMTVTQLTATDMTWNFGTPGDNMSFTRASGTAGNIVGGTWNGIDAGSGSTFNLTFNPDGTLGLSGVDFCGGGSTTNSDNQAPSVPTNVFARVVGADRIDLFWSPSSDNVGVTYYQIYRNGVTVGQQSGPFSNTWPDLAALPGTIYTYTVSACDASGNCSAQSAPSTSAIGGHAGTASGSYTYNPVNGQLNITVTGSNFGCNGPSPGAQTETITFLSATAMTMVDPDSTVNHWTRAAGNPLSVVGVWTSADGQMVVTLAADGTLSIAGNEYCGNSIITSIFPLSGKAGSLVTINGGNFNPLAAGNSVDFNGVPALVTEAHPGQLYVVVPAGATTGRINVNSSGAGVSSPQDFTVIAGSPTATLSWGFVYHRLDANGTEYDVYDAGINSYATTLAGMNLTVTKPDGSVYTFSDADIEISLRGQLAVYKKFQTNGAAPAPLAPGVYTFTLNDGQGNVSHRVATHVTAAKALPQVDSATIQFQRKADGSYRISWAPVNDTKTYYYRLRVALPNGSTIMYDSTRDVVAFADVPAGVLFDGSSYLARVDVFDAPVLYTNRSAHTYKAFTPQPADYDPGRLLTSFAGVYNRTDGTTASFDAVFNVDFPASVSNPITLTGPAGFTATLNPATDVSLRTGDGTNTIIDFYKKFPATPALPTGLYTFTFQANGITHTAYATLTAPVSYPVVDSSTMQAVDLGNGSVRFSWANVNHTGTLYYRVNLRNAATGINFTTARQNQAFADIPKTVLDRILNKEWRVEVFDSSNFATQRNRVNQGAFTTLSVQAYDPARPVVNSFRVRNQTNSAGASFTRVSASATAPQGSLASLVVTYPDGSKHDLLAVGRWSNFYGEYAMEVPGSPATGLYILTATDATGKTAVRYKYQTAAHTVPPVDYHTFHVDSEPNGDLTISWAPVISDVPLWFQVEIFAQADVNGDGLLDRVYMPYVLKDTNGDGVLEQSTSNQQASIRVPAADLPLISMPTMSGVRTSDDGNYSVTNNASMSVIAGNGAGVNYATLSDADQDGFANNVDTSDNNASSYPFSAGNNTLLPAVVSTTPAAAANNVAAGTTISVLFNKVLDQRTLPGKVTVNNGVTGTVTYNPATRTLSLTPSAPLAPGYYTVSFAAGVKDEAGNALAPFTWSFGTVGTVPLTLTINGSGSGQVNVGMTCSTGVTCTPQQFVPGTTVTLLASPSGTGSVFAGWSGACTGLAGCSVFMDTAKSVTATFTPTAMVSVLENSKTYGLFQTAYSDTTTLSGYTIRGRAVTLTGDLILNRPISITIAGGYDLSFLTNAGDTVVRGRLFIQNGRLNAKKLAVW
jgi:hypothetical protein